MFGSWPPPAFEELSDEQKASFWKSAADKSGEELTHVAKRFLTRKHVQGDSWGLLGTFQPLSWYKTNGYDTDRIENLTPEEDKEWHDILGMTYRVRLHTTSAFGSRTDTNAQELSAGPGVQPLKPLRDRRSKCLKALGDAPLDDVAAASASSAGPTEAKGPKKSGHDDDDDDDDDGSEPASESEESQSESSSSSSSSDDGKKKKKKSKGKKHSKKAKKSKKDSKKDKKKAMKDKMKAKMKAKQEKLDAAVKRKADIAAQKHASQIITKAKAVVVKLTAIHARLTECVTNKEFKHVPDPFASPIKTVLATFTSYIEDANIIIKSDGKVHADLPDAKDACILPSGSIQFATAGHRTQRMLCKKMRTTAFSKVFAGVLPTSFCV